MASGFNASDMAALRGQVQALRDLAERPQPLLKAWGVETLAWIGETFDAGGRPKWAPLAQGTINARRLGKNKSNAGSLPLQDSGGYRRSFDISLLSDDRVVIESNDPKAIWMEYGTKPHEIVAKHGHFLAIPTGPYTLAGLGRATPTGRGSFLLPGPPKRGRLGRAGQRVRGRAGQSGDFRQFAQGAFSRVTFNVRVPYKSVVFRQRVNHPGTPPRPVLPTPEQITPRLERVGQKVIDVLLRRRGGR